MEILINTAKTSMNSKLISSESELFSKLVVQAAKAVKYETATGAIKYPIRNVNIIKNHG